MSKFWEKFWENKNYITQVLFSLIILIVGLYMICTLPADDGKVKWAMGMVGIIIGYWLK
jgi:hypothetical protein